MITDNSQNTMIHVDDHLQEISTETFLADIKFTAFDKDEYTIFSDYFKRDEKQYGYKEKTIELNIPLHVSRILDENLPEGNYDFQIIFEKNQFNSIFIKEVSPSKTEFRLGLDADENTTWSNWINYPEALYDNFDRLLFINHKKYRIINAVVDYYDNTIIIKIDRPCEDDIDIPYDNCYIATEVYIEKIFRDAFVFSSAIEGHKIVNLSTDRRNTPGVFDQGSEQTRWYNYEKLLTSQSASLITNLSRSANIGVSDLNIDFSSFDNHIFFGSAEQKFINVFNKIRKIEINNGLLNQLSTSSDTLSTQRRYEKIINDLKDNMTQYERYVYTKSASYAWPKSDDSGANSNYSYTSSYVKTWYADQLNSASLYDQDNGYRLIRHVPEDMVFSDNSGYLVSLLNTWGDFFDYIKNYIDQFQYLFTFDYDWTDSVPRELLHIYGDMFGWQLFEGYNLSTLDQYILGYNLTTGSTALQEITQEKWLRLLSSIPYLNKVRGTRRSIDALLNIYGIPPSILTIREHGGTKSTGSSYFDNEKNYYALNFNSSASQYLQMTGHPFSDISGSEFTIEMKFSTEYVDNMYLFGNEAFNVQLKTNGDTDNYGSIVLNISGSDKITIDGESNYIPFYNGDWYSIILQRTGSYAWLQAKKFKDEQIFYHATGSVGISHDENAALNYYQGFRESLFFGSTGSAGSYSGSMSEIRIWDIYLDETVVNHHVMSFPSVVAAKTYPVINFPPTGSVSANVIDQFGNQYIDQFGNIYIM